MYSLVTICRFFGLIFTFCDTGVQDFILFLCAVIISLCSYPNLWCNVQCYWFVVQYVVV